MGKFNIFMLATLVFIAGVYVNGGISTKVFMCVTAWALLNVTANYAISTIKEQIEYSKKTNNLIKNMQETLNKTEGVMISEKGNIIPSWSRRNKYATAA